MIWTTFSSMIFLWLGIIASYSIGGFAYLILALVPQSRINLDWKSPLSVFFAN